MTSKHFVWQSYSNDQLLGDSGFYNLLPWLKTKCFLKTLGEL